MDEPDPSYHGLRWAHDLPAPLKPLSYILKMRTGESSTRRNSCRISQEQQGADTGKQGAERRESGREKDTGRRAAKRQDGRRREEAAGGRIRAHGERERER